MNSETGLKAAALERRLAELTVLVAQQEQELAASNSRLAMLRAELTACHTSTAGIGEREYLATLLRVLPDLVFVLDEDGRYVQLFTSEDELLCLPAAELQGRTLHDVLPAALADQSLALIRQTLVTGEPQLLTYQLRVPAGLRWFEGRTAVIPTTYDGKSLVIRVSRDITAQKEAEAALLETKRRYDMATSAGRVGIWEWSLDTEELYIDSQLAELLGYDEAGTLPQCVEEWRTLLYPEDLGKVLNLAQAYLSGKISKFEIVCRVWHQSGELRYFLVRGSMVCERGGVPCHLMGTFIDISARMTIERVNAELLTTLKRRHTQLQAAAEVSRVVSSILNPDQMAQRVVELSRERFELYYAGLFLVDRTGVWTGEPAKWAVLRAGTGEAGQQMLKEKHKLEIGGTSMIGWCIAHRQARIALDVGQEAVRFENPKLPHTHSELALPLISRGDIIGALSIQSSQEAAFSQEDITVFQTMADQLANALINAQLYTQAQQEIAERLQVEAQLRRRQEELKLLNSANRALASLLDLDQVLETTLERIGELLEVEASSVWLLDAESEFLVCRHVTGLQRDLVRGWELPAAEGIVGWVLQQGQSLIIADAQADERHCKDVDLFSGLRARSILSVPLQVKAKDIGVLQVISTAKNKFNATHLSLMESLAVTAAIAIDNAHLYEQTRQDAITKATLLSEANHRVKNNLTAIMGILALEIQETYPETADFHALLRDLLGRIQGMATVHNLLSEAEWAPLPMTRLVEEIAHAALGGSPVRQRIVVQVFSENPARLIAPRQATSLAIVINELVTNSIKHAFSGSSSGRIEVNIMFDEDDKRLTTLMFRDDGPGWPEKVLDGVRSGVGVRLMRLLVRGPLLDKLTFYNDEGALAKLQFRLVPLN
ncbi:MAG: GAF domain-containing protein [Anaerolineae bacterium]|nr:GAF domain-containing protein [Anaerolineae bacterium]